MPSVEERVDLNLHLAPPTSLREALDRQETQVGDEHAHLQPRFGPGIHGVFLDLQESESEINPAPAPQRFTRSRRERFRARRGERKKEISTEKEPINKDISPPTTGSFECNICLDVSVDPVVTTCGHLFCWCCLYQWLYVHSNKEQCPTCKRSVSENSIIPIYGRGSSSSSQEQTAQGSIPPRPHARVARDPTPDRAASTSERTTLTPVRTSDTATLTPVVALPGVNNALPELNGVRGFSSRTPITFTAPSTATSSSTGVLSDRRSGESFSDYWYRELVEPCEALRARLAAIPLRIERARAATETVERITSNGVRDEEAAATELIRAFRARLRARRLRVAAEASTTAGAGVGVRGSVPEHDTMSTEEIRTRIASLVGFIDSHRSNASNAARHEADGLEAATVVAMPIDDRETAEEDREAVGSERDNGATGSGRENGNAGKRQGEEGSSMGSRRRRRRRRS